MKADSIIKKIPTRIKYNIRFFEKKRRPKKNFIDIKKPEYANNQIPINSVSP